MKPLSKRERIYEQSIQKLRKWAENETMTRDMKLMLIKRELKLLPQRLASVTDDDLDE